MNWCEYFTDGSGLDWPRVLLVALTITVLGSLIVVAATSATAFGPYNPSWDGTSEFRTQIDDDPTTEATIAHETTAYADLEANDSVAFVIAPDEPYADEDAERVREFVADGGTLVVFENFAAPGNDLLSDIGAQARFDGQLLRDERNHHQGPVMPVATGVGNHSFVAGVEQITLNHATAVEPGDSTVLVRTSEYAYLTADNEELDDDDELAAYPVATVESVGAGNVIAVGDPSVPINAMIDQPDNAAFVHGLHAERTHVIVDLSHTEGVPPLTSAVLTLRDSAVMQAVVGMFVIGGVAFLFDQRSKQRRHRVRQFIEDTFGRSGHTPDDDLRLSRDQQLAYLREQYPEWDDERIERVMGAFNRTPSRERDNE
ncbi:DUF4350 domain-containing protein [Natrialbaceae archaeon A-gly3]